MSSKQKPEEKYPPEFLRYLRSVTAKRARTIIDYLLEHDTVTTAEIEQNLGYAHAPRAIRDVRELGIPVVMERVSVGGKSISRYRFGDPKDMNPTAKKAGRSAWAKGLKDKLIERYGARDFIYWENANAKDLQIDHRIPYEIGGDGGDPSNPENYMLLTASANRLKSHACETCPNWTEKDKEMCRNCFWAFPEDYSHVAGRVERILMITLKTEEEVAAWDRLRKARGEEKAKEAVSRAIIRESMS